MKAKVLLWVLAAASLVAAETSPKRFYSDLEQHLRSLGTLEIGYRAEGIAFGDSSMEGRMIWIRPDYFIHETPEWIHCDTRREQWRYLRNQNTLILETPQGKGDWLPETALLNLNRDLKPVRIEEREDDKLSLILESRSPEARGTVEMIFAADWRGPSEIRFLGEDGTGNRYVIHRWIEEAAIDTSLFIPPEVPAENVIDFRMPGDMK